MGTQSRTEETDADTAACFPAMQALRPHLADAAAVARADDITSLVPDTCLDNLFAQWIYFRHGMLPAALRFAEPLV